jgi:hypothetical protein
MRSCVLLVICSALALAQAAEGPGYTGPGSCASPSCHGGVQVRSDTSVLQNEYSSWVVKDKHSRAFSILSSDASKRIARLAGLEQPDTEPRCLACHALAVPEAQRARTFDLTDGVSCESCHGPASDWLGKHTEKGWSHERSVALGMKDLRDPATRAENCLTCHLGTKDKSVDHELIAAGHPDLVFELVSFTAAMPKHWKETGEKPNVTPDPWFDVRALAVSQIVELREQLLRVGRNAQSPAWPEYSDLDCFACHHSLTNAENSWQQQRGYPPFPTISAPTQTGAGRRPGNPPWNLSRYGVLRQFASEVDPGAARELEAAIDRLYGMMSSLSPDRVQVAALANSTADLAARLIPRMRAVTWDQARTMRMMKATLSNADYISRQGERSAEVAAMALRVLYTAYASKGKPAGDTRIQEAISTLFTHLENPSAYNAFQFADLLKTLNGVLP